MLAQNLKTLFWDCLKQCHINPENLISELIIKPRKKDTLHNPKHLILLACIKLTNIVFNTKEESRKIVFSNNAIIH